MAVALRENVGLLEDSREGLGEGVPDFEGESGAVWLFDIEREPAAV